MPNSSSRRLRRPPAPCESNCPGPCRPSREPAPSCRGGRVNWPQVSASIPDQLSKLASLLADGLLSREEFEHLKAKVIGQT